MTHKEFDQDKHRYLLDGEEVSGTTGILKACGLTQNVEFMSENARWRGQVVHKAVELYNKETLDWASVHPDILGYVKAYDDWFKRCRPMVVCCERWYIDEILRFGGKIDVLTQIGPNYHLFDIKTGKPSKTTRLQMAGYVKLLSSFQIPQANPYNIRRSALQLKPDGKWNIENYNDPRDIDVFISCCTIQNWRRNNYGK